MNQSKGSKLSLRKRTVGMAGVLAAAALAGACSRQPAAPVVVVNDKFYAIDPGQDMTQTLDVEFPAAALKAGVLKEVRIALVYAPAAYNKASLNFPVALGGK